MGLLGKIGIGTVVGGGLGLAYAKNKTVKKAVNGSVKAVGTGIQRGADGIGKVVNAIRIGWNLGTALGEKHKKEAEDNKIVCEICGKGGELEFNTVHANCYWEAVEGDPKNNNFSI